MVLFQSFVDSPTAIALGSSAIVNGPQLAIFGGFVSKIFFVIVVYRL